MKDLTSGSEAKTILFFAFPMLLGNVFQQFYNMVDSFVVGKFVGKQALAAVGQSFPIIFVSVALVIGFGMASNILVAQYYGARQKELAQEVIDTTVSTVQAFSLAMTAIGLIAAPAILRLMQTPQDVLTEATLYLRIIFVGSVVSFGYNSVSAILRGLGDSKTPLYALVISTLVNVALDLLFVIAFHWGVAGVGIATVIAQTVSFAWVLVYLKKNNPEFVIDFFRFKFDKEIFSRIFAIGLPSGIQQALVGAGLMTLSGVVNGFGTNPSAAYSAAGKLDSFAIMPAMNIGLAISSFTGQNLGAGRKDRVYRGLLFGTLMASTISVFIAALMFFFGNYFMAIFTDDSEVIRIGVEYLRIVSLGYLLQTLMFCFSGVIRGAGATFFTMLMTLLAMWIVRIPCAIVLSRLWGTSGIWWSIVIGFSAGTVGTILFYAFGKWDRNISARTIGVVVPPQD
jgi:putative MATE family efflux protein